MAEQDCALAIYSWSRMLYCIRGVKKQRTNKMTDKSMKKTASAQPTSLTEACDSAEGIRTGNFSLHEVQWGNGEAPVRKEEISYTDDIYNS